MASNDTPERAVSHSRAWPLLMVLMVPLGIAVAYYALPAEIQGLWPFFGVMNAFVGIGIIRFLRMGSPYA